MTRIIHYSKPNGQEAVIFTNDLDIPVEKLVGHYKVDSDEVYPIEMPANFPMDKEFWR